MATSSTRRIARVLGFAVLALFSLQATASFHLWKIDEIFSDATGSVQFIELSVSSSGEQFLAGHTISVTEGNNPAHTLAFPSNLPGDTANRHFLVATQGFAKLGIVTPDYVVPDGFLYVPEGTINYADVDVVTYEALPTDGVHSIDRSGNLLVNSPTNFAGQTASLQVPSGSGANYQGLWWAAPAGSESGWGINFAHQGDVIFATWFTYDTTGKAWWLGMQANRTAAGTYAGTIFTTRGPAFDAVPFDPSKVTETAVGSGTLTFSDANDARFAYTVNGTTQTKALVREVFGSSLPVCVFGGAQPPAQATNYQDLWWASPGGSDSGWGVNLTQQGDVIFATWFTYDAGGNPLWLSGPAVKTGPGVYTGTLAQTSGPGFNAVPFDPTKVIETPVGTYTLSFSDGANGTFAYTVNGVAQTKAITRQVFVSPGTVCS